MSVEGQYSQRHFTFEHDGSLFTDLVKGTTLIDESTGGYYNSPYFCGVCSNEKRDNEHFFVKATWFLSSQGFGSHNVVLGYDNFAGKEVLNNYQSGSNYVVGSDLGDPSERRPLPGLRFVELHRLLPDHEAEQRKRREDATASS